MFRPDDAVQVDSVKNSIHDIKIEPNGQLVFNKPFHYSKIINDNADTVFLIQPSKDGSKIYFSFADVEELENDEVYQSVSNEDKVQAEKKRNKLGYYTLENGGLQKGASVALRKCTDKELFREGYRGVFIEGESLDVDIEKRFVTAIIANHKFVPKKKTIEQKAEEKIEKLKGEFMTKFLENLRIYDGGEGKNQNLIEVQRQLRTSKKYKDLDFKLVIKEARELAEDLGFEV